MLKDKAHSLKIKNKHQNQTQTWRDIGIIRPDIMNKMLKTLMEK
jgi:hypothetical protein